MYGHFTELDESRLNRLRHETQQRSLTTITKTLSNLTTEQLSASITRFSSGPPGISNGTQVFHTEASRTCRIKRDPVERLEVEIFPERIIEDISDDLLKDQDTTHCNASIPEPTDSGHANYGDRRNLPTFREWTRSTLNLNRTRIKTPMGTISVSECKRMSKSIPFGGKDLDHNNSEHERCSKVYPASWLL